MATSNFYIKYIQFIVNLFLKVKIKLTKNQKLKTSTIIKNCNINAFFINIIINKNFKLKLYFFFKKKTSTT